MIFNLPMRVIVFWRLELRLKTHEEEGLLIFSSMKKNKTLSLFFSRYFQPKSVVFICQFLCLVNKCSQVRRNSFVCCVLYFVCLHSQQDCNKRKRCVFGLSCLTTLINGFCKYKQKYRKIGVIFFFDQLQFDKN